jgi:hypothetical protein
MSLESLEQRVNALERTVAELQRKLAALPDGGHWLDRIAGSMKDEPAFLEVLEYGRQFRHADRPPDDAEEAP